MSASLPTNCASLASKHPRLVLPFPTPTCTSTTRTSIILRRRSLLGIFAIPPIPIRPWMSPSRILLHLRRASLPLRAPRALNRQHPAILSSLQIPLLLRRNPKPWMSPSRILLHLRRASLPLRAPRAPNLLDQIHALAVPPVFLDVFCTLITHLLRMSRRLSSG